ncbi:MAG: YkgJ family cysteine cluster protein [Nanoarchaeota archaeon]|nr:YkgJ family cysteine cluster protein [Nanoarchaeota archaeon]
MSEESLWEKGSFAETLGPQDVKERMKTFHKKHDEDMNFSCKKCGKKISAHNKDWHACMCDECFDEECFPEEAQIFETNLEEIGKICKRNEKENIKFYKFLKTHELNQKRFEKIVKEIEEKIDCTKCGNCCKVLNTILTEKGIDRILKHLHLARDEFISKYLIKNEDGDFELKQKPCIFLVDNRCKIYDARPEECREYPHLNKDITVRGHQFLSNAEICPIVFNVLENAKEEFLEDIYAFENPEI